MCVDVGVKPSLLFDAACIHAASLKSLIDSLSKDRLLKNILVVLKIEDDIFVAQKSMLSRLAKPMVNPVLVDVSPSLSQPVLLSEKEAFNICSDITDCIQLQLSESAAESGLIDIELPDHINRSTLFGFLLNYPVVYWYCVQSTHNCLAMVPLCVVKVVHDRISKAKDFQYESFSFSIPSSLYDSVDACVQIWFSAVQQSSFGIFVEPHLTLKDVCLPAVNM